MKLKGFPHRKKWIVGIISVFIVGLILSLNSTSKSSQKPFVKVDAIQLTKPVWRKDIKASNDEYMHYKDKFDIVRGTEKLGGLSEKYYSKYIDYTAPNGKPIRLLAQDQVTDSQLLYAYSIVNFYLSNLGDEVANQMAKNEATLVIPNGADRDGETPEEALFGQKLNQQEIAPPGSKWYQESDYSHRDGSFEEIFHMVHDYGIGTTQNPQADPELAEAIYKALMNALPEKREDWGSKGLWANKFGIKGWLKEIEEEGSLEQEYIITVIDSYYGLWEAYSKDKGMWGGYIAKTRSDVINFDPTGYEVVDAFLPEYINVMMTLDESFDGTFSMIYNRKEPYTFKSQYLKHIQLTGVNNINVIGNSQDNTFIVNQGENIIDGMKGTDVVQFKGASEDYTVYNESNEVVVLDKVPGRDGKVILKNVEILRFLNENVNVKSEL